MFTKVGSRDRQRVIELRRDRHLELNTGMSILSILTLSSSEKNDGEKVVVFP